jgi:hypothetical protein
MIADRHHSSFVRLQMSQMGTEQVVDPANIQWEKSSAPICAHLSANTL